MRTIIGIPAMGSYPNPDGGLDSEDALENKSEDEGVDMYERPYNILFDGVSEALRLLRAKEYEKAKECLIKAQIEADEAICE